MATLSVSVRKALLILRVLWGALLLLLIATHVMADPIIVNCDQGQSLNQPIATLEEFPATVLVSGTCTEYVTIKGFEGLTLKGLPGATVQQPSTNPPTLPAYVLSIKASTNVTVSGLAVRSLPSLPNGLLSSIGIGGGSNQVRLQDVTTDGSWGIIAYEASQVWLVRVTVNITSGYAAISAFDKSDVHIVDGLIERPANSNFNAGILAASGHVTMQGMTIRDMQQSININSGGR